MTITTVKNARAPKVYLVKTPDKPRLVRAFTAPGAIKHTIATSYSAAIPSQDELITLISKGVKVEDAGEPWSAQDSLDLDVE